MKKFKKVSLLVVLALTMVVTALPVAPIFAADDASSAPEGMYKEGVYSAKNSEAITEGNKMFRCINAELKIDGNGNPVSIDLYLSGKGYDALYVGEVKEGAIDSENSNDLWTKDMIPENERIPYQIKSGGEFDGKYFYTVPVNKLNTTMKMGALSAKYGIWGSKVLTLSEDNFNIEKLSNEEIAEKQAVKEAMAVDGKIDAIGKVTLESENAIKEARAAYDSLSEQAAKKVTKLTALENAEKELADLKKPVTDNKEEVSKAPKTADTNDLTMWMILLAGAVVATPVMKRRINK